MWTSATARSTRGYLKKSGIMITTTDPCSPIHLLHELSMDGLWGHVLQFIVRSQSLASDVFHSSDECFYSFLRRRWPWMSSLGGTGKFCAPPVETAITAHVEGDQTRLISWTWWNSMKIMIGHPSWTNVLVDELCGIYYRHVCDYCIMRHLGLNVIIEPVCPTFSPTWRLPCYSALLSAHNSPLAPNTRHIKYAAASGNCA